MLSLRPYCLASVSVLLVTVALADDRDSDALDNWPQWRGPLATGTAPHGNPPLVWNEADGTSIRWKTKIPGLGHSTPIVWDDRIFLTTAIAFGDALPPRPSTAPGRQDSVTAGIELNPHHYLFARPQALRFFVALEMREIQ